METEKKNGIGEQIKKARKEKGMSQAMLGRKVGISQTMIAQYESGVRVPKINALSKIATALELKVSDFVGISDYLDEVEKNIKRTTNFYDYLGALGYEIGESEHAPYQMHIKETDTYIDLNDSDICLLKELEDSTNRDIIRTIDLLIATKGKKTE